jgi:hypothetical protein
MGVGPENRTLGRGGQQLGGPAKRRRTKAPTGSVHRRLQAFLPKGQLRLKQIPFQGVPNQVGEPKLQGTDPYSPIGGQAEKSIGQGYQILVQGDGPSDPQARRTAKSVGVQNRHSQPPQG